MKKLCFSIISFSILFSFTCLNAQTISTIAGSGAEGYNGDNQAATIASLNRPTGVAVDNVGNIYIADWQNNRIRKVGTDGFISTIIGNGNTSYNGESLTGTATQLYLPTALAIDQSGNLYVSETNNNRIRKMQSSGTVTTYAGNGSSGYSGDNNTATSAQISYPANGIISDAEGNVYFSDTYNNRIRKVSSNGIITTIAGTGVAGFNGDGIAATATQLNYPYGLTLDQSGNLIFVDCLNQRIRKITVSGTITTIAGTGVAGFSGDNGPAASAKIYNPVGIVIDGAGNLFFTDTENNRIRKISNTGIITTIAGTGNTSYNGDNIAATAANINFPNGVALDLSGNLLIAEAGNSRIRKVTNAGIILPLSFKSFTAQLLNGSGLLQWQTSNEVTTKTFVIEVSYDSRSFLPIDSMNAKNTAGTNTYKYVDSRLMKGVNYYRLKSVDRDGKVAYSTIVTLRFEKEVLSLVLAPNPGKGFANVSFSSEIREAYFLTIIDVQGKIVQKISGKTVEGINNLTLDLNKLISGSYFIKLNIGESAAVQTKFLKE